MAVRPIIAEPDPRLHLVSQKVERVDDSVKTLIADMIDSMYAADGIGLAAIQIGEANHRKQRRRRTAMSRVLPLKMDRSARFMRMSAPRR